jgi:hypothetical protein
MIITATATTAIVRSTRVRVLRLSSHRRIGAQATRTELCPKFLMAHLAFRFVSPSWWIVQK